MRELIMTSNEFDGDGNLITQYISTTNLGACVCMGGWAAIPYSR